MVGKQNARSLINKSPPHNVMEIKVNERRLFQLEKTG